MNFYNFRMSSLLYILDNTKHLEKYKCKKEDVLKFGGTHYCIDDSVNTIDSWAVPHNEMVFRRIFQFIQEMFHSV